MINLLQRLYGSEVNLQVPEGAANHPRGRFLKKINKNFLVVSRITLFICCCVAHFD